MEINKGLHKIKIQIDYHELDTIQRSLILAKRFVENHNFNEFPELEGLDEGEWEWREDEILQPIIDSW